MGRGGGAKERGGWILVFCLSPQNHRKPQNYRKPVILRIFLQVEDQDLCLRVNQITPLYLVGATPAWKRI